MSAGEGRFALIDRDGTINVDTGHLSDPARVELLPGAAEGLRRLRQLGLGIVVITNQSAIGRGLTDEAGLALITERLAALLRAEGASVDAVYHCPHVPEDGCDCRKPKPGLVLRAAADLGFDPARSFLVGDYVTDVELGRRVGATTILVLTGSGAATLAEGRVRPDHVAADLVEAAGIVERLLVKESV